MMLPGTDTRSPDDLFAAFKIKFGHDMELGAFESLARGRGVAVLDVVRAVVDDRLSEIVQLPMKEQHGSNDHTATRAEPRHDEADTARNTRRDRTDGPHEGDAGQER